MTIKEQIEILQAYERGEEIERSSGSGWVLLKSKEEYIKEFGHEYQFNFDIYDYRIKPKRWRAAKKDYYYCVTSMGAIDMMQEVNDQFDDDCFDFGNYFRTEEQAEKARGLMKDFLHTIHEEDGE